MGINIERVKVAFEKPVEGAITPGFEYGIELTNNEKHNITIKRIILISGADRWEDANLMIKVPSNGFKCIERKIYELLESPPAKCSVTVECSNNKTYTIDDVEVESY